MLAAVHGLLRFLLQAAAIAVLILLAGIVVYAVIMRKLGSSLVWYDEVAAILLVWLTYFGAAYAALNRAHLGFSGTLFALAPLPRTLVFAASEVITVVFFGLVAWYGYLILDILGNETLVSIPWLTYATVHSIIPIGAGLFIIAQLVSLPVAWRRVNERRSFEDEEIADAVAHAEDVSDGGSRRAA